MTRLLIRPERKSGEWAPCWISRSLKANGWGFGYEPSLGDGGHWAREMMDAKSLGRCDGVQPTIALNSPYLYKLAEYLVLGELLSQVFSGAVPLYALTIEPDFDGLALPLDVVPRPWRKRPKQRGDVPSPRLQRELFPC